MLRLLLVVCFCAAIVFCFYQYFYKSQADYSTIREKQIVLLSEAMSSKGLKPGDQVFIRIFKKERLLELWVRQSESRYIRFKTYPICAYSGLLGPKLKEGDRQAPEGFYSVSLSQMNPNSSYHLSFNLGFPNVYDQAQGRTGSFLMVHGSCVSAGCYAMTDAGIEEIYTLVEAALREGQDAVDVHIFPFQMRDEEMEAYRDHKWFSFWQSLHEGYLMFERSHMPPDVYVEQGAYRYKSKFPE